MGWLDLSAASLSDNLFYVIMKGFLCLVARPTPLSTVVHRLNTQTLTRSSLLQTVLNKVHELKEESSDDHHSG